MSPKKKPRTPVPPRKVQAPKVRQKQSVATGGLSMPGTNTLLGIGIAVAVGVTIALITVLSSRGGSANVGPKAIAKVATAMRAAGCSFRRLQEPPGLITTAQRHMSSPDEKVTYNSFPPADGVHNPTPAIWGDYRQAVDPRQAVHNLEHGGVVIWYGRIPDEERQRLDRFYDESPNGMLVTPITDTYRNVTYRKHRPIDGDVALTAWLGEFSTQGHFLKGSGVVARCPRFNENAFGVFRDTFRGKGPERFPVSSNKPGS